MAAPERVCCVCGEPWKAPDLTLVGVPVHNSCWGRVGDQRVRDIVAGRVATARAQSDA